LKRALCEVVFGRLFWEVVVQPANMGMGPCAKTTVRVGVILLIIAALASVWELLASQVPDSPFHIGLLPGPVASLRSSATILGLGMLAAAWLMPWASNAQEPRILMGIAFLGALMIISASIYGALHGMYGLQFLDPRPDATLVALVKYFGQLLVGGCLLEFSRRILFRQPPK